MIPSYIWKCHFCGASNPPGSGVCAACQAAAGATTAEIERGQAGLNFAEAERIEKAVLGEIPANDISRVALVWPALVPSALLFLLYLSDAAGAGLNIHGGAGAILLFIIIGSVAAIFAELVLVPRAVLKLLKQPVLRTAQNLLAIGFAILFLIGATLWLFNSGT